MGATTACSAGDAHEAHSHGGCPATQGTVPNTRDLDILREDDGRGDDGAADGRLGGELLHLRLGRLAAIRNLPRAEFAMNCPLRPQLNGRACELRGQQGAHAPCTPGSAAADSPGR
eukprot:3899852-Prymnesium_polylepis.2